MLHAHRRGDRDLWATTITAVVGGLVSEMDAARRWRRWAWRAAGVAFTASGAGVGWALGWLDLIGKVWR